VFGGVLSFYLVRGLRLSYGIILIIRHSVTNHHIILSVRTSLTIIYAVREVENFTIVGSGSPRYRLFYNIEIANKMRISNNK